MVKVSIELALILNLRNTAIDHKRTCKENCNVSIGQLKIAASYISQFLKSDEEAKEAIRYIEEMPIG